MRITAMGEVSQKVARLSEAEIVRQFRRALVAVYPVLRDLDCLGDDAQPYDDFEEVAAALWHVAVEKGLMWKYGLDTPPKLPPYGFASWEGPADGHIEVDTGEPGVRLRLVQFIGDRRFGEGAFNAVEAVTGEGKVVTLAYTPALEFSWVRA